MKRTLLALLVVGSVGQIAASDTPLLDFLVASKVAADADAAREELTPVPPASPDTTVEAQLETLTLAAETVKALGEAAEGVDADDADAEEGADDQEEDDAAEDADANKKK